MRRVPIELQVTECEGRLGDRRAPSGTRARLAFRVLGQKRGPDCRMPALLRDRRSARPGLMWSGSCSDQCRQDHGSAHRAHRPGCDHPVRHRHDPSRESSSLKAMEGTAWRLAAGYLNGVDQRRSCRVARTGEMTAFGRLRTRRLAPLAPDATRHRPARRLMPSAACSAGTEAAFAARARCGVPTGAGGRARPDAARRSCRRCAADGSVPSPTTCRDVGPRL